MKGIWLLCLCFLKYSFCIDHDFKGFDDSILFGINWPGNQELENLIDGEINPPATPEVCLSIYFNVYIKGNYIKKS